jgi:hypothetical protein
MSRFAATLLLLVPALLVGAFAPRPAQAAEYELETRAFYDVHPGDRLIEVTVAARMTNTTPDPDGRFSLFSEVKFGIHDGATAVTANDKEGALDVSVREEGGVNVATIVLRDGLRYERSVDVVLRYRLPDTESGQMRVRPSVVVFPAWGFGTASTVTVRIPEQYEIRLDGNELSASAAEAGITTLTSGDIAAPQSWLALLTATATSEMETRSASVALEGGTVDLQVEAFADDAAWADRTLGLLEQALPLIEQRLGLPYPHVGPLVVTESVAGVDDVEVADGSRVLVAYDAPPFTALRRAAGTWLEPSLLGDRWIRDGLASHVAAAVGEELEVPAPYDPATETEARAAAAFPLAEWPAAGVPDGDAYGEAASWAIIDEIASEAGDEALPLVLERAAAGIGAWAANGSAPLEAVGEGAQSLDSRSFLDQLETVADVSLAERFGALVLSPEDVELLPARAEALAAMRDLQGAAGDWGAPDPVIGAMRSWDFDAAQAQIEVARDWIPRRDDLLDRAAQLGLAVPTRLQQAYRTAGGGPEALTELEAELAVVEAYGAGLDAANAPRSLLERIGLVGGPDPHTHLATANTLFRDGDLRGAAGAISEADRSMANAEMGGVLRLAILAVALAIAFAAVVIAARRRRPAPRT